MLEFKTPHQELQETKEQIIKIYQMLKKESDQNWEIVTSSSIGTTHPNMEMDHYHEALGRASSYDKVLRELENAFPFLIQK